MLRPFFYLVLLLISLGEKTKKTFFACPCNFFTMENTTPSPEDEEDDDDTNVESSQTTKSRVDHVQS